MMKYVMIIKYNLHYDEVRGHVLRSPSGTKQQLWSKSKSKRFLWKQRTHKRTKSYRRLESHNTIYNFCRRDYTKHVATSSVNMIWAQLFKANDVVS